LSAAGESCRGKNILFKNSDLADEAAWHGACFPLGVNPICRKQPSKEIPMTNQISSKLAALAVALMMNSLLIGGVAYVFNKQVDRSRSTTRRCGRVRWREGAAAHPDL
jgi:hypothetical protein